MGVKLIAIFFHHHHRYRKGAPCGKPDRQAAGNRFSQEHPSETRRG